MPIQFYHECDPAAPAENHCWHFVYLHGEAELHMILQAVRGAWDDCASDLFVADTPMPEEPGEYRAMLYGMPVIAKLAYTHGLATFLRGRVASPDDVVGMKHVMSPEEWR